MLGHWEEFYSLLRDCCLRRGCPLVGLTGGICAPKRKRFKVPVEDAVRFQGPVCDLPLAPRKQSNHVSPQH